MLYKEEYDGVFNPYNFQIEHYEQLPEDISIEILSFADAVDISEIPIKVDIVAVHIESCVDIF